MPGQPDTVVKARCDRGLGAAVRLAKQHLRYAVHRTNEHGQRQYREVWDRANEILKAASASFAAELDPVAPH